MMTNVDSSWNPVIGNINLEPLLTLRDKVLPEVKYYPEKENIFRVFEKSVKRVRVVILGQDPYPTPSTAIGYAFAVNQERDIPPSLKFIQKEILSEDIVHSEDILKPSWKTLQHWIDQDVLLLNTALTVEAGKPGSHTVYWEPFIKRVVQYISLCQPCIWLLWGKKAQSFKSVIYRGFSVRGYTEDTIVDIPVSDYNYILEASHPVASLYGDNQDFIGCNHFYLTNQILKVTKKTPIIW